MKEAHRAARPALPEAAVFAAVWPRGAHLPPFATVTNVAGLPLSLPLTIRATSSIVQSSAGMHLRGQNSMVQYSTLEGQDSC